MTPELQALAARVAASCRWTPRPGQSVRDLAWAQRDEAVRDRNDMLFQRTLDRARLDAVQARRKDGRK